MGVYYERIVDVEATAEEAGPPAERMVDWMVAEGVITRRMSGELVYSRHADEGYVPGPHWARAVADASCTACGAVVPVTAWRWDPTFALGTLAFDFWNWPPLSTDFHTAFTHHLQHRTTHMGKL
ncbi:hypothetical protein ACF1AL_27090 [Streptomyces sp. NPDC014801]|uniref:hypothetical protein n=1 Tax=Streptomyces sp. NPDC014801 TaxID=3364916 RepID=UPI0036FD8DD5